MRNVLREDQLVGFLLDAYRQGAFPMADPDLGQGPDAIAFYTAAQRGVMPLSEEAGLHVPRSLRRALNSDRFTVRCDTAFESVVRACARPRPGEPDSWINETIVQWCSALWRRGHAHSVEAWARDPATGEDSLVGGVYGVCLGGAFFGESMFCTPRPRLGDGSRHPLDGTDASKVCLVRTIEHLRARGFTLFDAQFVNEHIARFGCHEIPQAEYMRRLEEALAVRASWGAFPARAPDHA